MRRLSESFSNFDTSSLGCQTAKLSTLRVSFSFVEIVLRHINLANYWSMEHVIHDVVHFIRAHGVWDAFGLWSEVFVKPSSCAKGGLRAKVQSQASLGSLESGNNPCPMSDRLNPLCTSNLPDLLAQ